MSHVAKYFVLNMRQPKSLYKKDEQIILSTWHGTPLKKLVFDMDNVVSANPDYKKEFYLSISERDYLIAENHILKNLRKCIYVSERKNINIWLSKK